MPAVGEVWRHARYYTDLETGEMLPKYLLVLALLPDRDIVYRLLTSRAHGRPEAPPCYHGHPLPGYYLGTPQPAGSPLGKPTWLDLRECADFDARDFATLEAGGTLTRVHQFAAATMCDAVSCAANAPDTTRRQASALYGTRALLQCP